MNNNIVENIIGRDPVESNQPSAMVTKPIWERPVFIMINEACYCLEEGVVTTPEQVDLAMIMGAGWPFFMGGVTMYLDMAGYTPKVLQKVFFTF